jgi:ketose-bisphosphate aldolase
MQKSIDVVYNAWNAGIVVPSFNIAYLPMVEPIVRAVIDQDSFALISTAQVEWELGSRGPREVMEEFEKWEDPQHVRLHLDHIPSVDEATGKPNDYYNIIKNAVDMGFYSVMIDGSHENDIESNINVTKKIVDMAHGKGVLVEAEVGRMFGYCAENSPPYEKIISEKIGFSTEEEAQRIVNETGCDWLSVAVGNMHGAMMGIAQYQDKNVTRLDLDHLGKLNRVAAIPLVIHGGSGIQIDCLRASFTKGVAKINVAKDIRLPYQNVIKEKNDIHEAQQAVYDKVSWLINEQYKICGSSKIIFSKNME